MAERTAEEWRAFWDGRRPLSAEQLDDISARAVMAQWSAQQWRKEGLGALINQSFDLIGKSRALLDALYAQWRAEGLKPEMSDGNATSLDLIFREEMERGWEPQDAEVEATRAAFQALAAAVGWEPPKENV